MFYRSNSMTKVRTVVPTNATPGKSLLQVVNPKTGKSVRVRVPQDAVPGAMIELSLPDEPNNGLPPTSATNSSGPTTLLTSSEPNSISGVRAVDTAVAENGVESGKASLNTIKVSSNPIQDGLSDQNMTLGKQNNALVSDALLPVATMPPVTQAPPLPPFNRGESSSPIHDDNDNTPLKDSKKILKKDSGCMSCLTNPGAFLKSLCA
jgi:hypothetical protein